MKIKTNKTRWMLAVLTGVSLFLAVACGPSNVELEFVAGGFNSPTVLTHPGDGSDRLFIADQIGTIHVIENGTLQPAPFLDISAKIADLLGAYDEKGLLGLAFHPDYTGNGKFYVYYSAPKIGDGINHESVISEFLVSSGDENLADASSERILPTIDQPEGNHNAGQLAFGPDGYLYIGVGDGGGAGDAHGLIGNGQDITNLLGTILRVDVDGPEPYGIPADNPFVGDEDGRDEIYAYGFRNPYKFSFGEMDGEERLIVADVGQGEWEELDWVEKGGNYGWRIMEGNHIFDQDLATELGIDPESLAKPFHEYDHSVGHSIIGGYVYAGTQTTELMGKYVFADWGSSFFNPSGQIFYLEAAGPGVWNRMELVPEDFRKYITAMGEDKDGELYVLTKTPLGPTGDTGEVSRIVFLQ